MAEKYRKTHTAVCTERTLWTALHPNLVPSERFECGQTAVCLSPQGRVPRTWAGRFLRGCRPGHPLMRRPAQGHKIEKSTVRYFFLPYNSLKFTISLNKTPHFSSKRKFFRNPPVSANRRLILRGFCSIIQGEQNCCQFRLSYSKEYRIL